MYVEKLRPESRTSRSGKEDYALLSKRGAKLDRVSEFIEFLKDTVMEEGYYTSEELKDLTGKDFR